ncbi:MAG: nucleoside deaminase [Gammaproteobacteria bacterium]|nr:MAG: nucleoside deaminase [Gammaproteobacteria bacterium]
MPEREHASFMARAIELAITHSADGTHGPFGAVVVHDGKIVGEGFNSVVATRDPTAHAEILAIRQAAQQLGTHDLSSCVLYASCEPCPMCLSAIYWARIPTVYYAATHHDAQAAGFDDSRIQQYLKNADGDGPALLALPVANAGVALQRWQGNPKRQDY